MLWEIRRCNFLSVLSLIIINKKGERNSSYNLTGPFSPSYSQVIAIWNGDGKDWANTVLNTNSTQMPVSGLTVIGALVTGYYPETKFWAYTLYLGTIISFQ
jgi:hypothetical protein